MKRKIKRKTNKTNKKCGGKTKKSTNKTCTDFCKNDYLIKLYALDKKNNNNQTKTIDKKEYDYNTNFCKQIFCDKSLCNNLPPDMQKKIKDGFDVSYSKKQKANLKKRGALSACYNMSDILDYKN